MAEVLELPERALEFVCLQDGELLLLDSGSGEMGCLPEDQSSLAAAELEPGTAVRVRFFDQKPVWLLR
jgi:hypothetical protein